jgi:7-cyano-7-deazaguanine synthase
MERSYVVLSGGIDSTTCLYRACAESSDVRAVSIAYGQRHIVELDYATLSCRTLDVPHQVIDLSKLFPKTSPLLDNTEDIPKMSNEDMVGVSPMNVPFRNGLMLSAVTALVAGEYDQSGDEWTIYLGTHANPHSWVYPDCTPEWTGAMANAIYVGTHHTVRLRTPLAYMRKEDVIRLGEDLGVDWKHTWSCYLGGEVHCGTCPTCRARRSGFIAAGVEDPTEYASTGEQT